MNKVPMPEIIEMRNRIERFGNYWAGGYADQPEVLMLELEAASNAIAEHEYNKIVEVSDEARLLASFQKAKNLGDK